MIAEDVIAEIRSRVDIVAVIGQHVQLKKAGRNWKGLCPFHGEKTPSFNVAADKGFFFCFGCQKKGDVFTFVMELEGKSFAEAAEQLAARAGIVIVRQDESPEQRRARGERSAMLDVCKAAAEVFRENLRDAKRGAAGRAYLESRGVGDAISERFMLGYAAAEWSNMHDALRARRADLELAVKLGLIARRPNSSGFYDRFRDRLVCPVIVPGGDVVGFSARTLPSTAPPDPRGEAPKYINSPESLVYKKSRLLFGLSQARDSMSSKGRAVLVEGNFDVITFHQAGLGETVAPLGTALTVEQVESLRRSASEVVICYDGDRAGRTATRAALEMLVAADIAVRVVALPDGEDPDSLVRKHGPAKAAEMVARAVGGVEYFCFEVWGKARDSADSHARALDDAARLITKVANPTKRDLIVGTLASAMKLDVQVVHKAVERQERGGQARAGGWQGQGSSRDAGRGNGPDGGRWQGGREQGGSSRYPAGGGSSRDGSQGRWSGAVTAREGDGRNGYRSGGGNVGSGGAGGSGGGGRDGGRSFGGNSGGRSFGGPSGGGRFEGRGGGGRDGGAAAANARGYEAIRRYEEGGRGALERDRGALERSRGALEGGRGPAAGEGEGVGGPMAGRGPVEGGRGPAGGGRGPADGYAGYDDAGRGYDDGGYDAGRGYDDGGHDDSRGYDAELGGSGPHPNAPTGLSGFSDVPVWSPSAGGVDAFVDAFDDAFDLGPAGPSMAGRSATSPAAPPASASPPVPGSAAGLPAGTRPSAGAEPSVAGGPPVAPGPSGGSGPAAAAAIRGPAAPGSGPGSAPAVPVAASRPAQGAGRPSDPPPREGGWGNAPSRKPSPPPIEEVELMALLSDHPALLATTDADKAFSLLTDGRLRDMYSAARQGQSMLELAHAHLPQPTADLVLSGKYAAAIDPRAHLVVAMDHLVRRAADVGLRSLGQRLAEAKRSGDHELERKLVAEILSTRKQVD
jgi:DNA primase